MALTTKEAARINGLMLPTMSVMATGICRLYLASPNPKANKNDPMSILAQFPYLSSESWTETRIQGAAALVMDRAHDAILLQIYELHGTYQKLFEAEFYYGIQYASLQPQFHAFESDDCVVGLSFSDKQVAKKFYTKAQALSPSMADAPDDKGKGGGGLGFGLFGRSKANKIPEISAVINVTHRQHVGIKGDGTFDLDELTSEWKALFKRTGIKKKDLQNPETAKVIMQTIAGQGYSLAAPPNKLVQATPARKAAAPAAAAEPKPTPAAAAAPAAAPPSFSAHELEEAKYTATQIKQYQDYQKALEQYEIEQKKYLEDLAEYERQVRLQQWEQDNESFLAEQAAAKRVSLAKQEIRPDPLPPALPPRKQGSLVEKDRPPVPSKRPSLLAAAIAKITMPPPPPEEIPPPPPPVSRPPVPSRPAAGPPLPDVKGANPLKLLQRQASDLAHSMESPSTSDRPMSRLFLKAIAGSSTLLKDASARTLPDIAKKEDPTGAANLAGLLISALATRRVQLSGGDDSEDDWSD